MPTKLHATDDVDGARLSILVRADPGRLKALAEALIDELGEIEVLENRTALVMVPCRDTAEGSVFHLGEVLVAEARVRIGPGDHEGYAVCVGRDLERALAVALLDAALFAGIATEQILAFVEVQGASLEAEDRRVLREVEATRVAMETF